MSARPVMVIAADVAWCEEVCRFLEPHGYTVLAAPTEAVAMEALDDGHAPSAILVDPATADRSFCQRLNAKPELEATGVFLVSAAPARTVYTKGAGASGYVRKAVALDYLILLLDDVAVAGNGNAQGTSV